MDKGFAKIVAQSLTKNEGIISGPAVNDGFRRLIALYTVSSSMCLICRTSLHSLVMGVVSCNESGVNDVLK